MIYKKVVNIRVSQVTALNQIATDTGVWDEKESKFVFFLEKK